MTNKSKAKAAKTGAPSANTDAENSSSTTVPAQPSSINQGLPVDLDARIKALRLKVESNVQDFIAAGEAVEANKENTAGLYAAQAAQTLAATIAFLADPEPAKAILSKVKCRFGIDQHPDYIVGKWLMSHTRGGGQLSKIATISRALRDEGVATDKDALERISTVGFNATYRQYCPKLVGNDNIEQYVGAELHIRLRDGRECLVVMKPEQLAQLVSTHTTTWSSNGDNDNTTDGEFYPILALPAPATMLALPPPHKVNPSDDSQELSNAPVDEAV